MDVYLNAVFCPLAMVDSAVFEQEGWHRDADGTVSGVVYNEMQGALASPDAQLQNALQRAMFPDTAYGFVSGGDPVSIPALTYEKYQRVYRRHYSADNCCITLYGKMDMAEKLAFLDEHYLSRMPKGTSRPRLTVQDQQNGVRVHIPYYTENPEPDQVQASTQAPQPMHLSVSTTRMPCSLVTMAFWGHALPQAGSSHWRQVSGK